MTTLAEVTHETFSAHLHSWFRMRVSPELVAEVELIEVELLPPIAGIERRPFRLVFRSRDPKTAHPQRTYAFSHDTLGELEIFVVPRGPDRTRVGMIYDALFS